MARKKKKPRKPVLDERVELRMSAAEKKEFQEAADMQGISLSHWLRLAAWQTVNQHDGKVQLVNLD